MFDLLKSLDTDPGKPLVDAPASRERERVRDEPGIFCAGCQAAITSAEHRISVQGSHEHRFMNPGGFLFHIACFDEAIGCAIVGPDSHEYPWFPGFAWRYALCGSCSKHLGWHFRAPDAAAFFGLILDRLIEPSERSSPSRPAL